MNWEVEEMEAEDKAAAEKVAVSSAQEVLEDIEETHEESVRQEQEVMETLSEAVRRIEEANLWKTLLSMDVFQSGSARNEIVSSANKKLRQFARENLEICVGIKSSEPAVKQAVQEIKLPFDQEEMQALKILAAKVLKRDVAKAVLSEYSPQVAQVSTVSRSGPTIATVQTQSTVKTQTAQPTVVKKQVTKKKSQVATKAGPGYIPPARNYVPPTQGGATVSTQGMPGQMNMSNLVANLIQTASGGNILATNNGPVSGADDINGRS
jgi:hypothetical protein